MFNNLLLEEDESPSEDQINITSSVKDLDYPKLMTQ